MRREQNPQKLPVLGSERRSDPIDFEDACFAARGAAFIAAIQLRFVPSPASRRVARR